MKAQRMTSLIMALFMVMTLIIPAFAETAGETQAPSLEASTQEPTEKPSSNKKVKKVKVKFKDQVTGKAIGKTQKVEKGSAASAPEAPDHSDLGFEFTGWNKDFSAVKKDITVTATYRAVHGVRLGDFKPGSAHPGGALSLNLPVVFVNGLTGDEIPTNLLASGKTANYDDKRAFSEYDQSLLVGQNLEWIRIELNLSGTPFKAKKENRTAYVLRETKNSQKKYGVPNGQPMNRGFAVFSEIKASADASAGSYTIKGKIVWRVKGASINNEAEIQVPVQISGKAENPETENATQDSTTQTPEETPEADDSADAGDLLVATQSEGDPTPVTTIHGQGAVEDDSAASTPVPESSASPEASPALEQTSSPEQTPLAESTPSAEETVSPEPTAPTEETPLPETTLSSEETALPEATASPAVAASSETSPAPEATAAPQVSSDQTAEPTAQGIAALSAQTLSPEAKASDEDSDEDSEEDEGTDADAYTVTFIDYNGSTIQVVPGVPAGYTPPSPSGYVAGSSPVQEINGVWSVFSGWTPSLGAVTANTTFMAGYESLADDAQTVYIDGFDGANLGNDETAALEIVRSHTALGYEFSGWSKSASHSDNGVLVTATSQYNLTADITVSPKSFASGKPKGSLNLALPIAYTIGGETVYSDALADTGKRADKYSEKRDASDYDQSSLAAKGIASIRVELDAFTDDLPFTAASLSPATVADSSNGFKNRGYALFEDIKVKSSAANGFYVLTGTIYWKMQGSVLENSATFTTQVRVTGASSSTGGSSYGGGSSSSDNKPEAKLVVEAITTDPLNPKAGENFDIVLSLKNTSANYYVQNIDLTYTSEEDALIPTSGSNSVYIGKIDKASSYEQRLPVKASPTLAEENVKVELSIAYQDKKLTALTTTQTVIVNVQQVQRMQLDELELPVSSPTAEDPTTISLGIFNMGRTKLYNVAAKVVSDNPNLSIGQSFYGGDMEPGTSKTAELTVTPLEAGEYTGTVEVSYEDAQGEVTAVPKTFTINVEALQTWDSDDIGLDSDLSIESETPEAPTAAEIMQYLPPWVYVSVGAILLLIILAIAVSARRRRRRMFEDDEMD